MINEVNEDFGSAINVLADAMREEDKQRTAHKVQLTDTQAKIVSTLASIQNILLEKNRRYGDSALNPKHIFNKMPADQSILVRLDDKLSRVMNSPELRKNDVADVIGYLVLLCVSKDWTNFSDQID